MEVNCRVLVLLAMPFIASCASTGVDSDSLSEVYVADFASEAPELCGTADVDLSHAEARAFLSRASQVDFRTIHDHYDYAPCYVEGTARYAKNPCEWQIRAGATGYIECNGVRKYLVCDDCDDLFE